jgi:hypothetical protein
MSVTNQQPDADPAKVDDYLVTQHAGERTRSAAHHAATTLNFVLLLVVAGLSFALFWVVATLIGVF